VRVNEPTFICFLVEGKKANVPYIWIVQSFCIYAIEKVEHERTFDEWEKVTIVSLLYSSNTPFRLSAVIFQQSYIKNLRKYKIEHDYRIETKPHVLQNHMFYETKQLSFVVLLNMVIFLIIRRIKGQKISLFVQLL